MMGRGRPWRTDVALVALYLVAALPLQLWSYLVVPLPFMNYGPLPWPTFLAYTIGAPYVGYLFWRGSPRARLAAYVFLSFDILRSARLAHWLPMMLDIAIILLLQTPAMRRLYPSMWSRRNAMWRRWARK